MRSRVLHDCRRIDGYEGGPVVDRVDSDRSRHGGGGVDSAEVGASVVLNRYIECRDAVGIGRGGEAQVPRVIDLRLRTEQRRVAEVIDRIGEHRLFGCFGDAEIERISIRRSGLLDVNRVGACGERRREPASGHDAGRGQNVIGSNARKVIKPKNGAADIDGFVEEGVQIDVEIKCVVRKRIGIIDRQKRSTFIRVLRRGDVFVLQQKQAIKLKSGIDREGEDIDVPDCFCRLDVTAHNV